MTAPLINLGITNQDVQSFELKYAAAWAQVPARLGRVLGILEDPRTSGAGKANILAATQNLEQQYADTSANMGSLLTALQMNQPIDVGLAAQTIPTALAVLAGTDQVEAAVGLTPGVAVSATIPWWLYLTLAVPLYFILTRKKRKRA